MLPAEIIRTKRDRQALSEAQIQAFVCGLVDESWSEGQVAALAMAVLLNGMNRASGWPLGAAADDRQSVDGGPQSPLTLGHCGRLVSIQTGRWSVRIHRWAPVIREQIGLPPVP